MQQRWLLLTLDRLDGNELVMTHELIAQVLGVRREGVTEAAFNLQAAGVIRYARGHISVLDRHALEQRSCECYRIVSAEYDRLLPVSAVAASHPVATQRQAREAGVARQGGATVPRRRPALRNENFSCRRRDENVLRSMGHGQPPLAQARLEDFWQGVRVDADADSVV